jgi:hypothetical protein
MNQSPRFHTACILGLLLATYGLPSSAEPEAANPAVAASSPASTEPERAAETDIASGERTKGWLGSQASGAQASRHKQTLSGPVMSKVHERYVKSFTTAVPEHLGASTNK